MGCRVWGSGFRDKALGFGLHVGFGVGFGVWVTGLRVQGSGFRVKGLEFRV